MEEKKGKQTRKRKHMHGRQSPSSPALFPFLGCSRRFSPLLMFSLKRWTLRGSERGRPQIADPPDLAVLLRCRPCIIQCPPPPSAAPASLEVVCELAAVPEYLQQVVCCSQITQFVEELQRSEGWGELASRRRRSAGWHAPRPCHRATIAAPSSRQWGLVEGRSNSCACLLAVILEVDRSCHEPSSTHGAASSDLARPRIPAGRWCYFLTSTSQNRMHPLLVVRTDLMYCHFL